MEPSERLDQAMNARRLELRMNWRQVAEAAGISYTALRAIRRGDYRPTELTAQALDMALQWRPGSVHAVLAGGDAAPASDRGAAPVSEISPSVEEQGLSASEALRRVIRASALELGVTVEAFAQAVELALRDLQEVKSSKMARVSQDVTPARTDLSDMVREARLAAGLSLQEIASRTASAPGAVAGLEADWLDRLERATLAPDELPEYPQLDALVYALHLDPARLQEAAGVQFMNVYSLWSRDGQSRALGVGPVSAEDREKLEVLMQKYRRAPRQ
ncbi:helix-turn-helix domain-containing protein [Streptomyces sp. NPDC017943]|uniref:helix-turn-helix domain-containing protein n=1 Tax=Streptomyces sp. NPDC017943 TaxID=3365019 RepID=UPI0037A9255F